MYCVCSFANSVLHHITLHKPTRVSFTLLCYTRQKMNLPQKRVQSFKLPTELHDTFTCQYETWSQTSTKKWIKSSLFCIITQQAVLIPYRFLRTTNWYHLQDDTNQLFCHRKMLLSMTRSDINFSTVLRAEKLRNRELRVMCVGCLGE